MAETIKEKLANLEKYMPNESDHLYEFGRLLSSSLPERVNAAGFGLAAAMEISDLENGTDDRGNTIQSKLVGMPPIVYGLLQQTIPRMAKAVGGEEFGAEVEKMYDEVWKATGKR